MTRKSIIHASQSWQRGIQQQLRSDAYYRGLAEFDAATVPTDDTGIRIVDKPTPLAPCRIGQQVRIQPNMYIKAVYGVAEAMHYDAQVKEWRVSVRHTSGNVQEYFGKFIRAVGGKRPSAIVPFTKTEIIVLPIRLPLVDTTKEAA